VNTTTLDETSVSASISATKEIQGRMKPMISIHEIRNFIKNLPESQETDHWGKPSFRLNNKIFAVLQEDGVTLTIKTSREDREIYTQLDPQIFRVPETFSNLNYMNLNINLIEPEEVKLLILKAWRNVAPKKLIKTYESRFEGDQGIT
jgi:hypothetical protein